MNVEIVDNSVTKRITEELAEKGRKTTGKIGGEETMMEKGTEKRYDAISKNGDTLELSEEGRALKKDGGVISEVTLMGYSKAKLKQLYFQKTITKQQYDKAMERKSIS